MRHLSCEFSKSRAFRSRIYFTDQIFFSLYFLLFSYLFFIFYKIQQIQQLMQKNNVENSRIWYIVTILDIN